jgi:T5SS/PEP-CTERM-associated repeat protein
VWWVDVFSTVFRSSLLASSAICVLFLALSSGAVLAADSLDVSAAPPGETYTVDGYEAYALIGVGLGSGEFGTLIVGSGAELETGGELLVGEAGGSTGTVTVEGVDARLSVASDVRIGIAGTGTATVSDGASVEAFTLSIGRDSGSSGALTLTGAGTSWLNTSTIDIAREPGSTGSLVVADGAWLGTYQGSLYMGAGGGITIAGPGTLVQIGTRNPEPPADWADADGFFSADEGTILVSRGARLESDAGYIGGLGSGLASMTVTGQGTVWRNGLSLYVGGSGNDTVGHGLLTVSDGARVSSNTSAAGVDAGSEGTIIVTGGGSLYEILARAP